MKSEELVKKMNEGKDISILLVDAIEKIQEYEKNDNLLKITEKHRLELLRKNQDLKKKLGVFASVEKLMDSAEIYGYSDLIK